MTRAPHETITERITDTIAAAGELRPRLRGVFHRYAALAFVPLIIGLVVVGDTAHERVTVIVYGVCVTAMLVASAVYHSGRLSEQAVRVFKRIDHATILLAIAGTYTAFTALALDGATRVVMLVVIWLVAVAGIAVRMLWLDAPYPLVAAVYLVVGWLALVNFPAYVNGLTGGQLALVVAGGVLYTAGAVIYALHRPNPIPAWFGYHELFHALVVIAAAVHFVAVAGLVRTA